MYKYIYIFSNFEISQEGKTNPGTLKWLKLAGPRGINTKPCHLSHLHFPLSLGILGVAVVVRLYHDEVTALVVNHKLARCVLEGV